jgi:hypothetical protein
VKRAALILKVDDAVVMVGIWCCTTNVNVVVRGDWGRLIHVECVLVYCRNNADNLGADEEPKQANSQPVGYSCAPHAVCTTA